MFSPRISVATHVFQQDLRRSLQLAMEMGAQGVQLEIRRQVSPADFGETARRQLLHDLREHELLPASAYFPLRNGLCAPAHLNERLHAIRGAIEFASMLKIHILTLRAGRIPSEENVADRGLFESVLCDLAAIGNRQGVVVCLSPSGDDPETVKKVIDSVKTGPIAVAGDIGGWVLHGQDPTVQLRELHANLQHVDIRDAIRDVDGPGREMPVGRGEVDWDEIAALLSEMEYAGWLNVTRTAGNDPIGDITRAVHYLKNLLPG